jgi:hypothetical protein
MNLSILDLGSAKDLDNVRDIISKDVNETLKDYLHSKRIDQYVGNFQGKVVNNNDPDKMGKCQIRVYGIFEKSIPDKELPWAIPDEEFIGSTVGSFITPPVGALVNVYFDRGDIYLPHYTTKVVVKNKMPNKANYKENYPDTMVFFETDDGEFFKINRKTKTTTYTHSSGTMIKIMKNGDVEIKVKDGANFTNRGANIFDASGKTTNIGGNMPVLYALNPDLPVTSFAQIGVSKSTNVGV